MSPFSRADEGAMLLVLLHTIWMYYCIDSRLQRCILVAQQYLLIGLRRMRHTAQAHLWKSVLQPCPRHANVSSCHEVLCQLWANCHLQ